MKKAISFLVVLLVLSSGLTLAQDNCNLMPLKGRHSIGFGFGMLNQQEATVLTVKVNAESNFMGNLYYNYWITDEWALELNAGILNAEVFSGVSMTGIEQKAATVVPVLAGARYYPAFAALAENVRPCVVALVGAHMGHSSSNKVTLGVKIGSETKVQSVFGSKLGLGVDAFLSGWMRLGLLAGYNIGSDFNEPVGTRENYSGFDLSLNFGIML
ncbi:MAG: hypothetical protein GYA14_02115 [Ignavibacteria bacterium]|nr:hypothetical protein [Ignavibacteria bacterium]